jgi:hypothetical protein
LSFNRKFDAEVAMSSCKLLLPLFSKPYRMLHVLLFPIIAVTCDAHAAEKQQLSELEIKALLGKGLSVSSTDMDGGKKFTGQASYAADGTLSGTLTFVGKSPIAFEGRWKLDGSRFCRTIVPLQPQEVCETWLKSGDKEVTIRVGGTDVAVSRWK